MTSPTDSYRTKLPKVDENSITQSKSFQALNALIPPERFCLRDERIEDFGVDASLEIRENGNALNFRAHVQVKGTTSLKPNKDGSYSLSVKTTNLNYLLNGQVPLYILHLQDLGEFRFVWARTEFERLASENPNWLSQKDITLRFSDSLDAGSIDSIWERIVKEGSLSRQLGESLILAQNPKAVLEIDTTTLEIMDPDKVLALIEVSGLNLVNEGYGKELLKKINLLSEGQRERPGVKTVKIYVAYMSGHYKTVKEAIALLRLSGASLVSVQQILNWMEASCDYQLGQSTSLDYTARLGEIAAFDDEHNFSAHRFEYLRRRILEEHVYDSRILLGAELREEFNKLSADEAKSESGLMFRFILAEAELGTILSFLSENLAKITMGRAMGRYTIDSELTPAILGVIQPYFEMKYQWFNEVDQLSITTSNPMLKCDVVIAKVILALNEISITQMHAKLNGNDAQTILTDELGSYQMALEEVIQSYAGLGQYERVLRAKNLLAEVHNFMGEGGSADSLFVNVLATSKNMGYAQVSATAEKPLSKMFVRMDAENASGARDKRWAAQTDDQVEMFASGMLKNMSLPDERLPNVLKEVHAQREASRERLEWCQQIRINRLPESSEEAYSREMGYFAECALHKHKSDFADRDFKAIFYDFKKKYCAGCHDQLVLDPRNAA